jgi:hypothetical protein
MVRPVLVVVAALASSAWAAPREHFYVCNDAGDAAYKGRYEIGEPHAGKPTWTNKNGARASIRKRIVTRRIA